MTGILLTHFGAAPRIAVLTCSLVPSLFLRITGQGTLTKQSLLIDRVAALETGLKQKNEELGQLYEQLETLQVVTSYGAVTALCIVGNWQPSTGKHVLDSCTQQTC